MTLMTMDRRLVLRDGQSDQEHQQIFDLIDHVQRFEPFLPGDRERCSRVVGELVVQTRAHFSREETLMARHRYPHAARHKKEHDAIIDTLVDLRKQLENDFILDCRELLAQLPAGLRAALGEHIAHSDRALVAELRQQEYAAMARSADVR